MTRVDTSADLRLFSYKLTHDTGFAPNPFHGCLTLATCKPRIRFSKHVGDWVAGFSSGMLNGDPVGDERLVYLMRIDEKMPFADYYVDPRFAAKIPAQESARCIDVVGDNIYGVRDQEVFQVPNRWHGAGAFDGDVRGHFVLISSTFAYFGGEPLVVPDHVRPALPAGQAAHGVRTADQALAQSFIDFVLSNRPDGPRQPRSWRTGDLSWREAVQ